MREPSGFSLIEAMTVVVILGIIAALAAPAFTPIVHDQELRSATEQVASLFHRARMRALADRRCTRVIINTTQPPAVLTAQVLNAYDCGDSLNAGEHPSTAPRIDMAAGTHWLDIAQVTIDRSSIRVEWDEVPTGTDPHADPDDSEDEVRYRPTGRIFSDDDDLTDDDGVVHITSSSLTHEYFVLLEAHGPICVLPRDTPPPGSGNNRSCP